MKKKCNELSKIDELREALHAKGITDGMIMSAVTTQKIKNVEKAIDDHLNAPFSGTLIEAKKEIDRLTTMAEAVMQLNLLRMIIGIEKSLDIIWNKEV